MCFRLNRCFVIHVIFNAAKDEDNSIESGSNPRQRGESPPIKRQKTGASRVAAKEPIDVFNHAQPTSFFLTKVHGISNDYNGTYTMSLKGTITIPVKSKI